MNGKAIVKLVSPVLIAVGHSMLLCALVSAWYGETVYPLLAGGLPAAFLGIVGWAITKRVDTGGVGVKEGCAVVTCAWLLSCAFGAIPFFVQGLEMPELHVSWTKAFYETVSGFTTTGSSIYSNVEIIPKGVVFWRSFTHWIGGMGIVVLAVAFLPKIGVGGMQAFRMEAPGPLKSDKLVPRISQTAKILYTVYLAITLLQVLLLHAVGVSWFDSWLHTFGTVGTGGFSNYNASVAGLQNHAAEYIIAFFMWLSGANFALTYLAVAKRSLKVYWDDFEFKVYTAITLVAIACIAFVLMVTKFNNWGFWDSVRLAFFQVATILTTSGFATNDFNLWPVAAVIFLVVLMFIGGSTGSTGGGLKVLRHIINVKLAYHEVRRMVRPSLVTSVRVAGRTIEGGVVYSVAALTLLYLFLFGVGTVIVSLTGVDLVSAFTASIANLGNIGPGLGTVGPASNYGSLSTTALWTLTALMLLGRLEIYTILVLLFPSTWKK